jgi:hypothetical protein
MRRRGFLAAALVSLLEIKSVRAADKECVHDHHCLAGRVCVEGQCVGTLPCAVDTDCTSPAVCRESICVTISIGAGGVTLVQPVTVNVFRRRRKRRHGRRRHR